MFLKITLSNDLKINEVMTEFFIAGFHAKRSPKEAMGAHRLSYTTTYITIVPKQNLLFFVSIGFMFDLNRTVITLFSF